MRILGIDFGERRIGLAVSDPLGLTAQGLPTITRPPGSKMDDAVNAFADLIRDKEVTEIVVGLPKNMDGSIGPKAQQAMAFADKLKMRFGLPVTLVDERLSTARAEREMLAADLSRAKRAKRIDMVAAQLILQAHLDARRGRRES